MASTPSNILSYVYKGVHKESGHFYIGYRARNKIAGTDDLGSYYFTSSNRVKEMGFCNFSWVILCEFEDGRQAFDYEQHLIEQHWGNPLLLNGRCRNRKFNNLGVAHSEEQKQKQKQRTTLMNRPLMICPHCNKQSNSSGNMLRWHFDNCKEKDNG